MRFHTALTVTHATRLNNEAIYKGLITGWAMAYRHLVNRTML